MGVVAVACADCSWRGCASEESMILVCPNCGMAHLVSGAEDGDEVGRKRFERARAKAIARWKALYTDDAC